MDKADAIQAYLAVHNGPVPFEDLMNALRRNGVDLGDDPKRPNRDIANVKTTISQNKRFRWADKKQSRVALVLED